MNNQRKKTIEDEKKVAYYSAVLNAWISSKFEFDKSLLFLSAGAIGLLVTLLTTIGVDSLSLQILYIVSLISFITCIGIILKIYSQNSKYLNKIIAGEKARDELLAVLDKRLIVIFTIGMISSTMIGMYLAVKELNLKTKEINMSEKNESNENAVPLTESINGILKVAPQGTDGFDKSLDGIQNLEPPTEDDSTSSDQSESDDSGGEDS